LRREFAVVIVLLSCEYNGDKETNNKKALIEKKEKSRNERKKRVRWLKRYALRLVLLEVPGANLGREIESLNISFAVLTKSFRKRRNSVVNWGSIISFHVLTNSLFTDRCPVWRHASFLWECKRC